MKAVFLDRDGTIIEDANYLSRFEDVRFMPFAKEGLGLMKDYGYKLIVITNQSGIGRGYFTKSFVNETHKRINDMLGGLIDGFYFCPHKPEDSCNCRKPKVGLVDKALCDFEIDKQKSFVVGDKETDIELGINANITPLLVVSRDNKELIKTTKAKRIFNNLYEVALWICQRDSTV